MKKLLLFSIIFFCLQAKAQTIEQTLLETATNDTNGTFQKENFYSITLSDGSKETIKTTFESYSSIISRDHFVQYYPVIAEKIISELVLNTKSLKIGPPTNELPILILHFKLNRNGVYVDVTDSEGVRNIFKNWGMITRLLERT